MIIVFRGKAATGKSTLAYLLGKKLSIPIICKDDIMDAFVTSVNIKDIDVINKATYNILVDIIQKNINFNADIILDVGLGNRQSAKYFFNRLDFKNCKVFKFLIECSDESEWRRRHEERLKNPLPNQMFLSVEEAIMYYDKLDLKPFDDEYIIDNSNSIEESFEKISKIINI